MREPGPALNIATAEEMRALGAAVAAGLRAVSAGPLVIGLEGDLGAGKTTLAGGLLNALGVNGVVRSPTYTLVEPYELAGGLRIYHVDLYRLNDPSELEALGLRDLLAPGAVLLIEWPSRAGEALSSPDLLISIAYIGAGRAVQFLPSSEFGNKLVRAIFAAKPELSRLSL